MLDALDRLRDTGPEYEEILANHGPMGAEALVQLGRGDEVPHWVEQYKSKLSPRPGVTRGITAEDWREHLGEHRLVGDWSVFLRAELQASDWPVVLATWWPRLLPGLAASATHGVIRTAHAVRSLAAAGPDPDPLLRAELADGLAFWAARYQTLPGAPGMAGDADAVRAIARLPRVPADLASPGPGIIGRLELLSTLRSFPAALDGWGPPLEPHAALSELISAAGRVLAAREDVPIAYCHTVTGPAAVRLVLAHLPERLWWPSVTASWQVVGGIVAAFADPRRPAESEATDPAEPLSDPALDRLRDRAVEHGDEHVIKLTEAAVREYRIGGDPVLIEAARRFRSRVPQDH